jgi:hypothetical protein
MPTFFTGYSSPVGIGKAWPYGSVSVSRLARLYALRVRLPGHEPFEGEVLVPSLGTSKRFPSDIFDTAQIGKPPP